MKDEELLEHLADEWETAAQLQRRIGGDTLEVVKVLDRLWQQGSTDRDAKDIELGRPRRGGGIPFRYFRYRRKPSKDRPGI